LGIHIRRNGFQIFLYQHFLHAGFRRFLALGDAAHNDVAVGDDADQPAVVDDGKLPDVFAAKQIGRFAERLVRRYRYDRTRHHVADEHCEFSLTDSVSSM